MADETKPTIDLNKMVALYVKFRDAKKATEERHKSELLPFVQGMEKIEAYLLAHLHDTKAESSRTEAGTFFKKENVSITVANRETYLTFIKENDLWDLADVRVAKTNVQKYMETPDPSGELGADGKPKQLGLPPGLNYRAEVEVQVRRS